MCVYYILPVLPYRVLMVKHQSTMGPHRGNHQLKFNVLLSLLCWFNIHKHIDRSIGQPTIQHNNKSGHSEDRKSERFPIELGRPFMAVLCSFNSVRCVGGCRWMMDAKSDIESIWKGGGWIRIKFITVAFWDLSPSFDEGKWNEFKLQREGETLNCGSHEPEWTHLTEQLPISQPETLVP